MRSTTANFQLHTGLTLTPWALAVLILHRSEGGMAIQWVPSPVTACRGKASAGGRGAGHHSKHCAAGAGLHRRPRHADGRPGNAVRAQGRPLRLVHPQLAPACKHQRHVPGPAEPLACKWHSRRPDLERNFLKNKQIICTTERWAREVQQVECGRAGVP